VLLVGAGLSPETIARLAGIAELRDAPAGTEAHP